MKIRELCHSKTFNRNITETYIRKFANSQMEEKKKSHTYAWSIK